jgi:hypothetical protein
VEDHELMTIGRFAWLTGTLWQYDEVGLLAPTWVGLGGVGLVRVRPGISDAGIHTAAGRRGPRPASSRTRR